MAESGLCVFMAVLQFTRPKLSGIMIVHRGEGTLKLRVLELAVNVLVVSEEEEVAVLLCDYEVMGFEAIEEF